LISQTAKVLQASIVLESASLDLMFRLTEAKWMTTPGYLQLMSKGSEKAGMGCFGISGSSNDDDARQSPMKCQILSYYGATCIWFAYLSRHIQRRCGSKYMLQDNGLLNYLSS
jgi:hypothetical protein